MLIYNQTFYFFILYLKIIHAYVKKNIFILIIFLYKLSTTSFLTFDRLIGYHDIIGYHDEQ